MIMNWHFQGDVAMLPNFVIIGAPRSGTTHLYHGLRLHPEVFMSDFKEPMYFAYQDTARPGMISDRAEYEALFDHGVGYLAVGEASTLYLYSDKAAANLRAMIPQAKLVAILRQPADRAFSQYTFQRFLGTEPLDSFEAGLAAENERAQTDASPFLLYRRAGLYGEQIPRYFEHFPRQQLLFTLQDDLDSHPEQVFAKIFAFLGVDPTFQPDLHHRTNASGVAEHRALFDLVKAAGRRVKRFMPERIATQLSGTAHERLLTRPTMSEETRRRLTDSFREDILKTAALIDRDLSHWLD